MNPGTVPQLFAFSLILTLSLVSPPSDAGRIYKWTDANGTVHYGEHPPANHDSQLMNTTTGKSSRGSAGESGASSTEAVDENEADANDTQTAPTHAQEVKPAKDKGICERARSNLEILVERGRIKQADESGEIRYLSDEQKAEQIEAAKKAVKIYC